MQDVNRKYAAVSAEIRGADAPLRLTQYITNMYAVPEGDKYVLRQRYGLTAVKTFTNNIQGLTLQGDNLYAVVDGAVKTLTFNGVELASAALIYAASERFKMIYNNVSLAGLSDAGTYFNVDSAGVLSQPTFPTGWDARYFTYLDGYLIFANNGAANILKQQFFYSGLIDATSFNALDFSSATEKPDRLVFPFASQNAIWLFGSNTFEVFDNAGESFQQIESATNTTLGSLSPNAIAEADNSVIFVGHDGAVYKTQGYDAVKISTPYIDEYFARNADLSALRGFTLVERGLWFYILTVPGLRTFAYCIKTDKWSVFKTHNQNEFKADYFVNNGKQAFCAIDNVLYKLDYSVFQDAGNPIEREFSCMEIETGDARKFITHYVQPDVTTGTTDIAQTQTPLLEMDYSDNDGATFSTPRFEGIGATGEYDKRARFKRLGSSRRRIYRFRCTENLELSARGAYVGIEVADA